MLQTASPSSHHSLVVSVIGYSMTRHSRPYTAAAMINSIISLTTMENSILWKLEPLLILPCSTTSHSRHIAGKLWTCQVRFVGHQSNSITPVTNVYHQAKCCSEFPVKANMVVRSVSYWASCGGEQVNRPAEEWTPCPHRLTSKPCLELFCQRSANRLKHSILGSSTQGMSNCACTPAYMAPLIMVAA